jgi:hypothetical protein
LGETDVVPFTVYPDAETVCLWGHHLNNNGTSAFEMLRSRKLGHATAKEVFDWTNVANKRIYNVKILGQCQMKLKMEKNGGGEIWPDHAVADQRRSITPGFLGERP